MNRWSKYGSIDRLARELKLILYLRTVNEPHVVWNDSVLDLELYAKVEMFKTLATVKRLKVKAEFILSSVLPQPRRAHCFMLD